MRHAPLFWGRDAARPPHTACLPPHFLEALRSSAVRQRHFTEVPVRQRRACCGSCPLFFAVLPVWNKGRAAEYPAADIGEISRNSPRQSTQNPPVLRRAACPASRCPLDEGLSAPHENNGRQPRSPFFYSLPPKAPAAC